jgi:alpha-L-fucosidase
MQPTAKFNPGAALFLVFALVLLAEFRCRSALADESAIPTNQDGRDSRLAWWRAARFGMFIHWGPISVKGTEISWSRAGPRQGCPSKSPGTVPVEEYDNLYKQFNPTKFDAESWVKIAELAGMKYMVLTTKHCDGFCLWDSQASDYNILHTPFGRDVCAELAQAAHRSGMHIGWYYSPMDWRDPDCRTERNAKYVSSMQRQLGELLGNYGPIDLLWFDFDSGPVPWDQPETYALIRRLQPKIVVNNRLDLANYQEYQENKIGPNADYYTPEQKVGTFDDQHPWETCMTLGTQWSWKPDDRIKTVNECVRILVRCAAGDGNLLLNVGPMPSGEIEPRQVEVLNGIGQWLRKFGQCIYGTRGGPLKPLGEVYSTRHGNKVYVHVLKWTGDNVAIPTLPHKIVARKALTGGEVIIEQTGSQWVLHLAKSDQSDIDTVIELQLDGSAEEIPTMNFPNTTSPLDGAQ